MLLSNLVKRGSKRLREEASPCMVEIGLFLGYVGSGRAKSSLSRPRSSQPCLVVFDKKIDCNFKECPPVVLYWQAKTEIVTFLTVNFQCVIQVTKYAAPDVPMQHAEG